MEKTENRLTRMLLSKSRRAQYVRLFAGLAVCVVIAVVVVLHQNGVAMTHEEQVLTCPETGVVAHTHNESCYDADGNLVCPLPERELHTHTDDCYTEVRELVCTLEESPEHTHTDECYTVMRELTCGKEEVTEEHVHGPGCFTTVVVEDPEPEATTDAITGTAANTATDAAAPAQTEVSTTEPAAPAQTQGTEAAVGTAAAADPAAKAMPAQSFEGEVLDDKGNVWVHVSVNAPEGAFPADTTMRVAPLNAEDVRTKVEDALKKNDALVSGAKQMKAVDITFFDKDGKEIEPAVEVEVKITSDTVRDIKDPVLVHVDKDEQKEAEVVKKVDVVNKDEKDKTEGKEDTLKFQSNAFSPYVIVEPTVISANVITAEGETYAVTVSYGEDAGIPSDATLSVTEIVQGDQAYNEYAEQTAEKLETDVESFDHLRMFDIKLLDSTGAVLEPKAAVNVEIKYVDNSVEAADESEAIESIDEEGASVEEEQAEQLKVVHFADKETEVIDPSVDKADGSTETVSFTTESFSVYSVVQWKVTEPIAENQATGLEGKQYAIVYTSGTNGTKYAGEALKSTNAGDSKINVTSVYVLDDSGSRTVYTSSNNGSSLTTDNVTQWIFEDAGNNYYYIKSVDINNNTKYLRDKGSKKLQVVDDRDSATKFNVVANTDDGTVRIQSVDSTNYLKYATGWGNPNKYVTLDSGSNASNFILCELRESGPTQTVSTVQNPYITIRMFDYNEHQGGNDLDPASAIDDVLVQDHNEYKDNHPNQWTGGYLTQGILERKLVSGSDGSLYPEVASSWRSGSYTSAEKLFSENNNVGEFKGKVSGNGYLPFLESVYRENGYYHYDARENFAHFNDSSFTVYDALGSYKTEETDNNKTGEFYPYLNLDSRYSKIVGNDIIYGLKYDDNRRATDSQKVSYFGMSMDFSFYMPESGKVQGQNMKYTFSGDDDVWVYIDGVLVLDIGGRHTRLKGTIDFATGEITIERDDGTNRAIKSWTNVTTHTTLYKQFEQAGVENFKDYFEPVKDADGNQMTTKYGEPCYRLKSSADDFRTHTFNMYYLEHYATASNLMMEFNLPPMPTKPKQSVTIAKELGNHYNANYGNQTFEFRLLDKNDKPMTLEGKDSFTLKPGEEKTFEGIDEGTVFKVQEINVPPEYDVVKIGDKTITPSNGTATSDPITVSGDYATYVTVKNDSEAGPKELQIKKETNDESTTDKFRFKIELENTEGEYVAYNNGTYYVKDKDAVESSTSYTTDENGITGPINAKETIVVKGLASGVKYKVSEYSVVTSEMDPNAAGQPINESEWSSSVDNEGKGTISPTNPNIVTVTNTKSGVVVKLKKIEKDSAGEEHLLGNATFALQYPDGKWKKDYIPGGTNATNPIALGELFVGDYVLEEKIAPAGYNITEKFVNFRVHKVEEASDPDYGKTKVELTDPNDEKIASVSEENGVWIITIENTPGSPLPNTGGIGTAAIYTAGAMLVGIAAFGLVSNKMRNNL